MSEQSRTPAMNDEGIKDTPYSTVSLETTLLHGLFSCPARFVCEIVDALERMDFADDDHYEICALIAANAREVVRQAPGDCLNPVVVQAQLRDAGRLTESMSHKVIAVASTGRPPVSRVEIGEIVKALRLERTRRAMRIAADGSTAEMAKAISDAVHLVGLADRAGLNAGRLHAVDAVQGVA